MAFRTKKTSLCMSLQIAIAVMTFFVISGAYAVENEEKGSKSSLAECARNLELAGRIEPLNPPTNKRTVFEIPTEN